MNKKGEEKTGISLTTIFILIAAILLMVILYLIIKTKVVGGIFKLS